MQVENAYTTLTNCVRYFFLKELLILYRVQKVFKVIWLQAITFDVFFSDALLLASCVNGL